MPDWNRDISFGRKKGGTAAPDAPAEKPVPFWKKEIGGKKKSKPAAPAAEKPVPFWKKEIGGKKKPKPAAPAGDKPVPFWKKEIGRKKQAAPEPAPVEAAPVEAAAPPPAPVAEAEDYSWLTDRLDAHVPPVDAAPAAWPPRSSEPAPAAAWPPPSEAPAAATAPAPEPPAAPAPEPELEPEPKVPFWKKEIGGKKKEKPAKAKGDGVPFWKRELGKPKAPKVAKDPAEPKVPFWKKEIGGKKKGKPAKAKGDGVPFWKRELGTPKAAKGGSSGRNGKRDKATIVGLKIGASQLAAACVHNNGSPQLLQFARAPLESGVVVGGELRDLEKLSDELRSFFAKNKLPKKGIRLGIANNRIGVRIFELTGITDEAQLANAIRFRAQEALPIPLEEAVLDWQVLGEETNDEGVVSRRVLLVVAYRELVDRYISACKRAGLRLEGIDLEAFGLLRALAEPADEAAEVRSAQVVVNIGHDRSTFAVSDGRICEFTRVLAWGGQNLNVGIARALDIAPSEAAPIKHGLSLLDDTVEVEDEDVSPDQAAAACAAVRSELQSFAVELVSSLRFYQGQPRSLGIEELVISGGSADLPGLADELARLVGVGVRVGDPLARVTRGKKIDDDASGSLTVAIGLGIED